MNSLPRSRQIFARCSSSTASSRDALLKKIYAPFANLQKGSPEYQELAVSGKVWEDYHHPADSGRMGYVKLNKQFSESLREIDAYKDAIRAPRDEIARDLVQAYAHQSVQLEDNKLKLGDSLRIGDYLALSFFQDIHIASISAYKLSRIALPDVGTIVPNADPSQVAELRNHIVASRWVNEAALSQRGTSGLNEDDIRHLSAVINKGTSSEALYSIWGKRSELGDFRTIPISVRSNPLRVFPYPPEVPAIMKRFIQWRDRAHLSKKLHPLILACQICVYFVSIHPFPDGNGRVCRLLMQDYLLRQGYFPVGLRDVDRPQYLRMISDAQDGDPGEFVAATVTNQLEAMHTFQGRHFMTPRGPDCNKIG